MAGMKRSPVSVAFRNLPSKRTIFSLVCALAVAVLFVVAPHAAHAETNIGPRPDGNFGGQTWTKAGSPYVVNGYVYMRYGSLTIEPGTVIKLAPASSLDVHSDVPVSINGTAVEPVYFTSLKDDSVGGDTNGDGAASAPAAGDWGFVSFGNGSWNNQFNAQYFKVRYGGSEPMGVPGATVFPALMLTYWWYSGSPGFLYNLSHIEVSNSHTGLLLNLGPNNTLTLSNSSFHDNDAYGIYKSPAIVFFIDQAGFLDGSNNWWGDASGPYHATLNPSGVGNAVGGNAALALAPWLTADPFPPPPPPPPPVEECCSSVLFLPGIEGSRLSDSDEKLWEPGSESDIQKLYMDASGQSVQSDIAPVEVIDKTIPVVGQNIYKSFLADLSNASSTGKISGYAAYPYDWRSSIPDILADGSLEQKLRTLAAGSQTGKVTIVAHSNGGLVAKALINALGPNASSLIDNLVLVGVPQLGTPQAIGVLMHGYDAGLPFSWLPFLVPNDRARDFAKNLPMTYHLLPHNDYFSNPGTIISEPLVTFMPGVATQPFIDAYGATVDTVAELNRFVRGEEGRIAPTYGDLKNPAIGNSLLLSQAEQYIAPIDSSWLPPAGITVHQIAGVGENTLTGITYKDGPVACALWRDPTSSTPQCLQYYNGVLYDPDTAVDGDGTVVLPSALAMSTSSPNVHRWWVNLDSYNLAKLGAILDKFKVFHTNHADLLEIPEVRSLVINQIISSSTSPYSFVSSLQPTISPGNRLLFKLHSPLDMWAVDGAGNRVSSSTTAIPDASYTRYGEVQVISVPQDTPITLHMKGEELGIFTLDVEEFAGDTLVASTTFAGVPTTDTTAAQLNFPDNTLANAGDLTVDFQNDGINDLVLEPKINDVVVPDITPPVTSASLSGTLGENGWYLSDVAVTLDAVDDESGVQNTYFALDGAATSTGTSLTISTEGLHALRYYSTDNAGNIEEATSTVIKVDKTAPEATLGANATSKDLLITGSDALSSTTVTTVSTSTVITDKAGHATTLAFKKTYTGKYLSYARLSSIRYGIEAPVPLPTSFAYIWDTAGTLVSQTLVVDNQFVVQALYDKKKNKTTLVVLKKNVPIQTSTVMGLAIVKLSTNKGQVSYGW